MARERNCKVSIGVFGAKNSEKIPRICRTSLVSVGFLATSEKFRPRGIEPLVGTQAKLSNAGHIPKVQALVNTHAKHR